MQVSGSFNDCMISAFWQADYIVKLSALKIEIRFNKYGYLGDDVDSSITQYFPVAALDWMFPDGGICRLRRRESGNVRGRISGRVSTWLVTLVTVVVLQPENGSNAKAIIEARVDCEATVFTHGFDASLVLELAGDSSDCCSCKKGYQLFTGIQNSTSHPFKILKWILVTVSSRNIDFIVPCRQNLCCFRRIWDHQPEKRKNLSGVQRHIHLKSWQWRKKCVYSLYYFWWRLDIAGPLPRSMSNPCVMEKMKYLNFKRQNMKMKKIILNIIQLRIQGETSHEHWIVQFDCTNWWYHSSL